MPISKSIQVVKQNKLGSSLELKRSFKMDTNNMRDGSAYLQYFLARYATAGSFNSAQFSSNSRPDGGYVRLFFTPVVPGDYLVECLVSKASEYTITTETGRTRTTGQNGRLVFVLSCADRQKVSAAISGNSDARVDGYWYFHGCKITLIRR